MRIDDFRALVATRMLGLWDIDDDALAKLARHHELYDRWNLRTARRTVRDTGDVVERDYCQSLVLAAHISRHYVPRGTRLIADVGSGAGFPGAVVAATLPHVTVHLVEPDEQKALFLHDSTRGWKNVKVRSSRVENLPDHFDLLIARDYPARQLLPNLPARAPELLLATTRAEAETLDGFTPATSIPWEPSRVILSYTTE